MVSIVVPVYNASKYIVEGIGSILDQTYKNIEVLLIDDFSTDDSYNLISKIDDPRVKIFKNTKNLGAGPTRNKGIKNSSGEFIYFFDADDYMDKDYIEKLVNSFHSDVDLVVGPFVIGSKTYNIPKKQVAKKNIVKEVLLSNNKKYSLVLWNKLYRSQIIKDNNIYFQDIRSGQDYIFNVEYSKFVKKVLGVRCESYYYYREMTEFSITKNFTDNHILSTIKKVEFHNECTWFPKLYRDIVIYRTICNAKFKVIKSDFSKSRKKELLKKLMKNTKKCNTFVIYLKVIISFKISLKCKLNFFTKTAVKDLSVKLRCI